jgi:hypothetical protein
MSKRRKNKVENPEVKENVKEETMKKEETVERTEDIQDLTDEELGVEPEEVDDNEYEYDEDGNRIKIVYVEVEKPNKVKAFFNKHKKLFTGILIGTLTAGAGAAGAAIAYNVAGKKENGGDYSGDIDGDYTMKVTTNDQDLIDKITEDVMNSATTSPTSDGIMEF